MNLLYTEFSAYCKIASIRKIIIIVSCLLIDYNLTKMW